MGAHMAGSTAWVDPMGRLDEDPDGRAYVERIAQVCGGPLHVQRARDLLPLLELQAGQTVLEVGCGPGAVVGALAELTHGRVSIVGVDPSRVALDLAVSDFGAQANVAFRHMDGRALEFTGGEFDAAYCSRVLIHAAEPRQVVAEMARVVKPGGRVMGIEPVVQPCTGIDDQLRRKVTAWTNPDVARQLPALMRDAGLVDVTVTPHVALNAEAPNARALRAEFEAGQGRYFGSVRDGQCTADEVIQLLDQMQAVADRGEFLECLVHYAVIGARAPA